MDDERGHQGITIWTDRCAPPLRTPLAGDLSQSPHSEQRFPPSTRALMTNKKKKTQCAYFLVASQLESDGLRAYVRAARIGNWATHRRHSAHDTGTRPGLRRCLGGGGSALPEGEPDPCTSVGRTVYTADCA